ncbi:FUSC family protein [Paenibacillus sp. SYP-B4298]|uniref:FUSC family protein n=1 Tax=Paenibacillus sp. SYP-B4298 TaxID=2996034 RepID=UPI0022DD5069|nr:aromatic acid exporter family protein [Paenibacillus sp. SYP-B4298]
MTIGARVIKTGLAVALAIFVSGLFGFASPLIAAVAAIFTIQPSIYRSWKQILDQLQANLMGAAVALTAVYLIGSTPIAVGLVCIAVIILTIRLKMDSAIGLTLVTVVAVMEAHSAGWLFAFQRLAMVLTGMGAAFLVNVLVYPPRPRKQFNDQVHEAFDLLSLLLRTAISNEMKEQVYNKEKEKLQATLRKLQERYQLFEEERAITSSSKQSRARQLLVSRQMIRSLQKGVDLLEVVEEHYIGAPGADEWAVRFDRQIEEWTKYHEHILLKAEDKMKPGVTIVPEDGEYDAFKAQLISFIHPQLDERKPFIFVGAALMEYAYHLRRLEKLIEQVQMRQRGEQDEE